MVPGRKNSSPRPRARLGASTAITKKVVSVRVMRKVLHRLVIFLSGTSKNAGKGPFCKVDAGARLFFHEKVAVARPRARLGASTAITKKNWCLYAWCVKFYTVWSMCFFSSFFPFGFVHFSWF